MEVESILSLRQHAYELSRLISEVDHSYRLRSVSDWLAVAASVESVNVVTGLYDESLMWCSQARTYEDKRSELLSQVAKQLSIFNFCWGAFDSVVDSSIPKYKKQAGRSKTNRACWHLRHHCDDCVGIDHHSHFVDTLRSLVDQDDFYRRKYASKFSTDGVADDKGIGISVVRHIRNDLAHGSASIPVPDTWEPGDYSLTHSEWRHPRLIAAASRIVLFTIQMLLLSLAANKDWEVERLNDEADDYELVPVGRVIRSLHLDVWR